MSVGKRSNEDAPSWQGGETGSAIGDSVSANNDGVNPKDMTEILDAGFSENHISPINNHIKEVEPPYCQGKQSWIKRLILTIRKCFSCEKVSLLSIATAMCTMQLQAYQTATVDGITWKYEVSGSGCKLYGAGDTVYNTVSATTIPQNTSGDIVIPDSLNGLPVTSIMNFAFAKCEKITSVIVPDTVTSIGQSAFGWCINLEKIILGRGMTTLGHMALCARMPNTYTTTKLKTIIIKGGSIGGYNGSTTVFGSSENIQVYVSTKWTLPAKWMNKSVSYYDPIPEIGSAVAKNLTEALCYATDDKLKTKLDNESKYNAFRSWANGVCGTSDMAKRQAVVDSPLGWFSYVIDADSLLTKVPVQGDMSIDRFAPNAEQVKTFDLDISIADISVGDGATSANLAEVFSVEGATAPNGEYSSDSVSASFSAMSSGKVRCVAAPKDSSATSFFMRVRMNP